MELSPLFFSKSEDHIGWVSWTDLTWGYAVGIQPVNSPCVLPRAWLIARGSIFTCFRMLLALRCLCSFLNPEAEPLLLAESGLMWLMFFQEVLPTHTSSFPALSHCHSVPCPSPHPCQLVPCSSLCLTSHLPSGSPAFSQILKPGSKFLPNSAMSLIYLKTLLVFLCQVNKAPDSLAGHMILRLHSLSPARTPP